MQIGQFSICYLSLSPLSLTLLRLHAYRDVFYFLIRSVDIYYRLIVYKVLCFESVSVSHPLSQYSLLKRAYANRTVFYLLP